MPAPLADRRVLEAHPVDDLRASPGRQIPNVAFLVQAQSERNIDLLSALLRHIQNTQKS
jgi:hypothetical protein